MGFIFRKFIMSLMLALVLLPVVVSASTEFKGKETVNINRASAETLAAYLKGVGANKAEAIVKYRKANGKFKSISDLNDVPGIGEETYKDIKKNVSTSRGKSVAPDGYKMPESSGKSSLTKKKTTKKKSATKKKASSDDDESSTAKKTTKKKSTAKKSSKTKKSTSKDKAKKTKTTKAKKSSSDKKTKSKKKTKSTKKKKPAKKKKAKKKKSSN